MESFLFVLRISSSVEKKVFFSICVYKEELIFFAATLRKQ